MRLKDLVYIIRVAETGSITKAAKELYLSQPSLSNAISNLEEEMGIQIFNRTSKGVTSTKDGEEFLTYANQVMEQVELLNRRYKNEEGPQRIFSVSGHHYSFVVEAFVDLLKEINADSYQANLNEGPTYKVIEDVEKMRSEIGFLYISYYNENVLQNTFEEKQLSFTPLLTVRPYLFVFKNHPLANKEIVKIADLRPYPRLNFDQGDHNSFYFFEEVLADVGSPKSILVNDRATLFNLAIGLNGYTISSGILNEELNGEDIISVPLDSSERINIGYIVNNHHTLSETAKRYLELLEESLRRAESTLP